MASAGVMKLEKTSLHRVEPKTKVNNAYYWENNSSKMIPEMDRIADSGWYTFQQDGAGAHNANTKLEHIRTNCNRLYSA